MGFWNPIDNPFMGAGIVLLALSYREAANAGTGLQGFATNAATYIGLPLAVGAATVAIGAIGVGGYYKLKEHLRQKKYEERQQQAWLEEVQAKERQLEWERTRQEQERTKCEHFRSYVSKVNKFAEKVPENNKLNTDEIRENYEKYSSGKASGEFFNPQFCYDKITLKQAKTNEENYQNNVCCEMSYPSSMFKMIDYNKHKETLYLRLQSKEYKIENVAKDSFKNEEGKITFSANYSSIREVHPNELREKELGEREKLAFFHKFCEHANKIKERCLHSKPVTPITITNEKSLAKAKTL